jgi:hypothetical protein
MPATKLVEEFGISGRGLGKDVRLVSIFRCLRAAIGRKLPSENHPEDSDPAREADPDC